MDIKCSICEKTFNWPSTARRHEKAIHGNPLYECSICNMVFNRKDNYRRHMKVRHMDKAKPIEDTLPTTDKPMDATTEPETSASGLPPVEPRVWLYVVAYIPINTISN